MLGWGVYYQTAIAPHLTAQRFEVQVVGDGSRLVVEVDEGAQRVAMKGGSNRVNQFIATGDYLFVLASDVGADTDSRWLKVSLSEFGTLPAVLDASRLSDALSIGVKDCRELKGDAADLASTMLSASGTDGEVCGNGNRNIAEPGTVIVKEDDRQLGDLTKPPTDSVVDLGDVSNREQVLVALQRLLAGA